MESFSIWLSSSNSSEKVRPGKLLTWIENNKEIVWDKNNEKKRQKDDVWRRRIEKEWSRESNQKWGGLNSIGATTRLVEEQRQIQAKSYSYVERVSGLTDSRRTGESQIKPCKGN